MIAIVTATAVLALGLVGFSYALYATPERVRARTVRLAQRRGASDPIGEPATSGAPGATGDRTSDGRARPGVRGAADA